MTGRWQQERLQHWFSLGLAQAFTEVLGSLAAGGPPVDLAPAPTAPDYDAWQGWQEPFWAKLSPDLAEGASLQIGCDADTARRLTALITGDATPSEQIVRESCLEVMSQTGSALAGLVGERLGRTVQFGQAVEATPAIDGDLGLAVQLTLEGTPQVIAVVPNEALLQAILAERPEAPAPSPEAAPDEKAQPAQATASDDPRTPALEGKAKNNLELLLEVELDLSVSFGRTLLPLQDVIKLASGSIVELNRSVTDPVDVLVNNSVIARGDVVVVDGNYGIRITEVVSRKERIRSIF